MIKSTPVMDQYLQIKAEHPDALLFFRMGDFYELFFEDAVAASSALDITLTRRGKAEGQDIPMCGVPVHTCEVYLHRLIKKGFRVALCDQVETPSQKKTKAPLKREVVRIVTPGTVVEESLLDASSNNYLVCLYGEGKNLGLAACDISTGEFLVESPAVRDLSISLSRLNPSEILAGDFILKNPDFFDLLIPYKKNLTSLPKSRFDYDNSHRRLLDFYKIGSLEGLGSFTPTEVQAAGTLLDYIHLTQKNQLPRLAPLKKRKERAFLEIDGQTRRNLELFSTLNGEKSPTLFSTLNQTCSSMGARLLAQDLACPLIDLSRIQERLMGVGYFMNEPEIRAHIRQSLEKMPDLERTLSRLCMGRGGPRDLGAIKEGLLLLPPLQQHLAQSLDSLQRLARTFGYFEDIAQKLSEALDDNLPLHARDGDFIRPGFHGPLDEMRHIRDEGKTLLLELQSKYILETDIPSLKIKHNNIIGYHIEVTTVHTHKVPTSFIHRQTMAGAQRFTTLELAELEKRLASAADQAIALELRLFEDLTSDVTGRAEDIRRVAQAIARLDVLCANAYLAEKRKYTKPVIDDSCSFHIVEGRHPVIEYLTEDPFTPNDCDLKGAWLLTGPNMAGKSTFMRQNALIAIMAHMGLFVPATSAHIGLIDRIFTRIGAGDDLAKGHSTFMVEMIETATILNQASSRSFVILDEIGRGTSTFDGVSIAWACLEHLCDTIRCRTLFATHYHELTQLQHPSLSFYTMAIQEWEKKIVFKHQIVPGTADRSYGVHVAELAGLPSVVIQRAFSLLESLEVKATS